MSYDRAAIGRGMAAYLKSYGGGPRLRLVERDQLYKSDAFIIISEKS